MSAKKSGVITSTLSDYYLKTSWDRQAVSDSLALAEFLEVFLICILDLANWTRTGRIAIDTAIWNLGFSCFDGLLALAY